MIKEMKYQKTKKALRKLKKREEVFTRKRLLPTPKNISYTVDESGDFIIVRGEVEKDARYNDIEHFIRFKLSGQEDFSPFGYQAKIPIQNYRFQFEVLQDALLEQDYIEIQLFNTRKQYSERAICQYEKVQAPAESFSRITKYTIYQKQ